MYDIVVIDSVLSVLLYLFVTLQSIWVHINLVKDWREFKGGFSGVVFRVLLQGYIYIQMSAMLLKRKVLLQIVPFLEVKVSHI